MKRKVLSLILVLILAFSTMLLPNAVAATTVEDKTQPTVIVETLTISQKKVITGDIIRASVVITDDSFISEAYIFYESPETKTVFFMPMLKNANTGKFIVDMPIDNYTECGEWKALYIAAADEHGNEIIVGNSDEADVKSDISAANFNVISVFAEGEEPHDYRITIDQTLQLEILAKSEVKWSVSDESVAKLTDIRFGYEYDYTTREYKGCCTIIPNKTGLVDVYAEDKEGNIIGGARILVVKSVKNFKVYLDYQGGKVDFEYIEVPVGYALELPSTWKSGYSFSGWSRNPDAKKGEFFPFNYFVPNNDVKLYAIWQKSTPVSTPPHELKLNLNDGITPPEVTVFEDSVRYILPEPQREGYTCIGWSTQKYAVVPKYTCGSNISINSDMELYAVWIENGCEECCDYVVELHETPEIEFKTFYKVEKWISADGSVAIPNKYRSNYGDSILEENEFYCSIFPQKTGITEFYALDENDCIITSFRILVKESTKICKVNFDATGGEITPSVQNVKYNEYIKLPTPTREGYACLGWSKQKNSTKIDYNCSSSFRVTDDTTLYAVWHKLDPDGYQVIFDYNDGMGTTETLDVNYGDYVTLPTPTRDGYICLGWATEKDAIYPRYILSANMKITEDIVYYAVWKDIDTVFYDVILHPKYADSFYEGPSVERYKLKYGESLVLPTPTTEGYTCIGWATSHTASEVEYACGELFTPTQDISLYGLWIDNSTVTLGDVNSDGNINSTDALQILQHSVGKTTLVGEALVSADVNKEGKINSTDALMVLQYAVGKITEF